jgi:hypothetical protein
MQNKQECKVIGIEQGAVTILMETGRRERLSKELFSFSVSVGDEVWAYLDEQNEVAYIERKTSVTPTYVAPAADTTNVYVTHATGQGYDEGSFWGGFFLTFFFPVIGLLIALVLNKPETRRGAVRAIVVQLIVVALIFLLVICAVMLNS